MKKNHWLFEQIRASRQAFKVSCLGLSDDVNIPSWCYRSVGAVSMQVAIRAATRFRLSAISDWNDLCDKVAERYSERPEATARAMKINYRIKRMHRPFDIVFGRAVARYDCASDRPYRAQSFFQKRAERDRCDEDARQAKKRNSCNVCGVGRNERRVIYRSDVYGWNGYVGEDKCHLCTGCWNKAKAVIRREQFASQLKKITNKLNQEIRNGKNNNVRGIA